MGQRLSREHALRLWQEYREGEIVALGEILDGYYPDLYGWGHRFSPDQEVVKDCIQETFLTLWKKQQTIGAVDNVLAYLMVMLKRRILYEKSKQTGTMDLSLVDTYEFLVEFAPDFRLIQEEHEVYQLQQVAKVINQLPARQKELVYLRFYKNLSFEQIAEIMQLGRQSVYNLFQKSLKSMRKHWSYGFTTIWLIQFILHG
ncbi:RNA polymerase sigma factor (sigma-70 family) [Dyadobacter jejuensis]|uniref:RNA polymerase sigma factor (Sigma-70 family) n=1 Tax=Dyadobacter jejuensis TaxID=1082580 RepID=A0A316AHG3_9BACT|nr:sigma-70 family RNA polymerase sigma factor [Dyadobacter jejuensis]PWJ56709.1 RNA polymerase sigma factor (sigma-70 family) [Dyadobacter jejuensis]